MPEFSQDDYDKKLEQIMSRLSAASLLSIPGVYEVLSDELNNAVIDALENEREEREEPEEKDTEYKPGDWLREGPSSSYLRRELDRVSESRRPARRLELFLEHFLIGPQSSYDARKTVQRLFHQYEPEEIAAYLKTIATRFENKE